MIVLALALAVAAGIALADAGALSGESAFVLAAGSIGVGAATRAPQLRVVCALAAFAGAGALALAVQREDAARARPDRPCVATVDGRVAGVARLPGMVRAELSGVTSAEAGVALPSAVRVQTESTPDGDAPIETALTGDQVRARLRLRPPVGLRNPGGGDLARTLARSGIGALARLDAPALLVRVGDEHGAAAMLRWLRAGREAAAARLAARGEGGALLATLALGDRRGLPPDLRDAFARLGLSHLLSVSGLHLVLVAGGLYALALRAVSRRARIASRRDARRVALRLALAGATVYALGAGWGVPVQRSLVLIFALAASALRGRPTQRGAALAAAAVFVLAREPESLFDAGAQMSFAASAALSAAGARSAAADPETPLARRALDAIVGLLAASSAAMAASAPLAATRLGVVAPAGLLANLAFVPWTGFVLLPAALAAGLLAVVPGTDPALGLLGAVAGATCRVIRSLAGVVPPVPGTPSPSAGWIVAAVLAALPAILARRTGVRVAACAGELVLLALARPAAIAPAPPRAVFLEVGQGDATLVQGERASVLVDGGPAIPDGVDMGAIAVAPALAALAVDGLALVVATHADLDHRGGLPAVLERVPVQELWLPPGGVSDPAFTSLRSVAGRRGTRVVERGAGDAAVQLGDLVVAPLWPPRGADGSRNARSLVVRVSVGGRALLLTGDLDAAAEGALVASGAALASDVLKLAHHGSRTSSSERFLEAVSASVAIASAPCGGRFGMPHPETFERAERAGLALWWTGRDGAVVVGLGPRLAVYGWGADAPACRKPALHAGGAEDPLASLPAEDGAALLDESALRLARVASRAERTPEGFLSRVRLGEGQREELAHAAPCRSHGERGVGCDDVGEGERGRKDVGRRHDPVHEADLERALRRDGLGGEEQLERVRPGQLAREQHGRVARGIEAERHLLEREGRMRCRHPELRGEQEIEPPGARVAVDGADEGRPEVEAGEEGGGDASQALHLVLGHTLPAREALRRGDRGAHVHARAEHALACSRQHGAADLRRPGDATPRVRELAEGRGVERVRALGPVERDERDAGVVGGECEADGHGPARLAGRLRACASPTANAGGRCSPPSA